MVIIGVPCPFLNKSSHFNHSEEEKSQVLVEHILKHNIICMEFIFKLMDSFVSHEDHFIEFKILYIYFLTKEPLS